MAADRLRAWHPGQPRPGARRRWLGGCPGWHARRPGSRGPPARPHLQSWTRRAARDRPRRAQATRRGGPPGDRRVSPRTGVVIMTYGSPRDLDDVGAYMTRVRGGREPSPELVKEFRHRYALIGMSPLVSITVRQASGMQALLGEGFEVAAGMRFSEPTIAQAVKGLVAGGAERIVGLILSPQYSPILMAGYRQAIEAAAGRVPARTVEAWHLNPAFIDVLASRIRGAMASYPDAQRDQVPVLLTAHSLPRRVVDREPEYVEQLKDTA